MDPKKSKTTIWEILGDIYAPKFGFTCFFLIRQNCSDIIWPQGVPKKSPKTLPKSKKTDETQNAGLKAASPIHRGGVLPNKGGGLDD